MSSEESSVSITDGESDGDAMREFQGSDSGEVVGTGGDVLTGAVSRGRDVFTRGEITGGSVLQGVVVGIAESTGDDDSVFILCQFPGIDAEFPVAVSQSDFRDVKRYLIATVDNTLNPVRGDSPIDNSWCYYWSRDTVTDSVRGGHDPVVFLPVFAVRVSGETIHVVNDVCTSRHEARGVLKSITDRDVKVSLRDVSCDVSVSCTRGAKNRFNMSDGVQLRDGESLQHYMTGVLLQGSGVGGSVREWCVKRLQVLQAVLAVIGSVVVFGGLFYATGIKMWVGTLVAIMTVVLLASWLERISRSYGLLPEWVVENAETITFTGEELVTRDESAVVSGIRDAVLSKVRDRGGQGVSESDAGSGGDVESGGPEIGSRRVESVPVRVLKGEGWVALRSEVCGEEVEWVFNSVNSGVLPSVVHDVLRSVPVVDGESVVTVVELRDGESTADVSGDVVVSECGDWGLLVT